MDFASLHELLRSTYDEMMPLCAQMTGIAKGIAGLGALFYIALRVWASIARAEAIDVFPLLRPFVLGFCIMFFPTVVLGTMNAVLSPVVQGTEMMVHQQEGNLAELTAKRDKLQEEAYLRNPETAYLVSNEKFDEKIEEMGIIGPEDAVTIAGMYAERAAYQTKQWIMKMVHDLLELLFHAAGLIIELLVGDKIGCFRISKVGFLLQLVPLGSKLGKVPLLLMYHHLRSLHYGRENGIHRTQYDCREEHNAEA